MKEKYNTLEYYNRNAKIYCDQTLVGNLQENYNKFLKHLPPNAYILDFGCGSGRDSKYFLDNGYKVKAIDGSIEMCKLASKYIKNLKSIQSNFLLLKLFFYKYFHFLYYTSYNVSLFRLYWRL